MSKSREHSPPGHCARLTAQSDTWGPAFSAKACTGPSPWLCHAWEQMAGGSFVGRDIYTWLQNPPDCREEMRRG